MEYIKGKDIKNRKVSIYKNVREYVGDRSVGWVLKEGNDAVREKVEYLRNNFPYHSKEYTEFKNRWMSAWITGGTVSNPLHRDSDINDFSNLLCVDIDYIDNPHMDPTLIKQKIFHYPWCYACVESVSGKGLYVIIPIKDHNKIKEYIEYLSDGFLQWMNIKIDGQCKNIARLRYISYDSSPLIKEDNEDIMVFDFVKHNVEVSFNKNVPTSKPIIRSISFPTMEEEIKKRTFHCMEEVINSGYIVNSRGGWYHIGCELKNHPYGKNLFIKLSLQNPKYMDSLKTIEKKWEECEPCPINDDFHRKWQGMYKNMCKKS